MNSHFQQFFADCIGTWISDRTYHYLTHQEVERSHTEFVVQSIERDHKAQVLVDNQYSEQPDLDSLPGIIWSLPLFQKKAIKLTKR